MELRTTREMRRNEQLSKALAKKAEASDAPAKAQTQPARTQAPTDKVSLSRQALAFVQEQNRRMWESSQEQYQPHDRISGMLDALETSQQQLDYMEKELDILDKCQKIAAAIMRGDNVPPEDMVYLMEHDQEGFKLAMAMRKPKEDPEDVKSVLDGEDKNSSARESGGEGRAVSSVSASGAPSGGGDTSAAE